MDDLGLVFVWGGKGKRKLLIAALTQLLLRALHICSAMAAEGSLASGSLSTYSNC